MANSLLLGGSLELMGGPGGLYNVIDEQGGFGDPVSVTDTVRSQLTAGSFVTGDFTDNRPISLQVMITASSRLALTVADDALRTQVNQRFNTLQWTPSGGYQLTFDTFRGQCATQWSGTQESAYVRIVTVTMQALPFGRSTQKVSITGQSSSIQLGFFNQATQYPYKTVTHGLSSPGTRPDLGFYQEPVVAVTGNVYGPQTTPAPIDGQSGTMRIDADFYTWGGSGPYTYYQMEAQIPAQPVNPKVSVAAVGTQVSAASTALAVPYPTSPNSPVAQQILILVVSAATAGAATVTTPGGWTVLSTQNGAAGAPSVYTFWKKATGTESGTLSVVTSSATPTWKATIFSLNAARLSSTPYAHVIGAVSASTVTTVTTSSLTVDTTAPQGDRFTIAVMQGSVTSSANWSAESWASLTGVTGAEVQDAGGVLIYSASATGGSASTFAATTASTTGYAYVAFDIVEAQTVDLSANTQLTFAVYVGSAGNVNSPYADNVAAWLTLVDGSAATQHFYMTGPAPGFSPQGQALAGWQYLTCSLAGATINLTTVKTWQLDINNPGTSYALPSGPNAYYLGMFRAFSLASSAVSTLISTVVKIPGVTGSAQAPTSIFVGNINNLLTAVDSSLESGIGTWVVQRNCTVAQSSLHALDDSQSLQMTSTTFNTGAQTGAYAISPNTVYTAAASFLAGSATGQCAMSLIWQDASHVQISSVTGVGVADSTGGWVQASVTATAPSNAAFVLVVANVTVGIGGDVHYVDSIALNQGTSTAFRVGGTSLTMTTALLYRAPSGTPTTTPIVVPAVSGVGTTVAPSTFAGTYRLIGAASADIHTATGGTATVAQLVNGTTVASFTTAASVAEGIHWLDFGDVTLPLVDVPSAASNVTYTITVANSPYPTDLLLLDTRGFLVWAPTSFTAVNNIWIDETTVQAAGGAYGGNAADRSDAVSLLGGVGAQTNGAMSLDPGDNYLLACVPDGVPGQISVSYYPRYLGERTTA